MSETTDRDSAAPTGYTLRWQAYQYADHHELAGYPSSIGVIDEDGDSLHDICRIECDEMTIDDAWAAANLISKAPELLQALSEVREEVRHPDYDWPQELSIRVRELCESFGV